MTPQPTRWPTFFFVAALFNVAVGVPLLLVPATMLAAVGVAPSADFLFQRVTGLFVLSFGLGYYMISREPRANRNLVWLGTIGKSGVVVLAIAYFIAGLIPAQLVALTMGDLFFVLGFAAFLITTP